MRKGMLLSIILVSLVIIIYLFRYEEISGTGHGNGKNEVIVLTVLAGQSTTDAGIEDIIDEELADKFPDVRLEWECVDWGEKFNLQMQARFAAGDIPDLIIGKAQDVYAYSNSGNLSPVPAACIDKIEENELPAVTVDGTVYGLPLNMFYQGVIYNKSLFEQYQLPVPTTLEELQEAVEIFSKHRVTPFAAHLSESWQIGNMTMQFLVNDVFYGDPFWGDRFRRREVSFSKDETITRCLLQNQYILENSWPDALNIDQYECDKRFIEGEAAMYLTGSWSLQSINDEDYLYQFGIFPYPNSTGDSRLIRETNITLMKSNRTKHGELVDQILEELVTSRELVKDILDFTKTYSTLKEVKPEYSSCLDEDIDYYESRGQVVEATIGNNQLIWSYQNDVALKQQQWLEGKLTLEAVLQYADQKRQESSNK